MKNFHKKIVLGFTLTLLVIPEIFSLPVANAVLGVGDVTFVDVAAVSDPVTLGFYEAETGLSADQLAAQGTTAIATKGNFLKFLAELGKKVAGQALKKVILERLVDATIEWIQGGAKGAIISDWNAFLQQAGEDSLGILIENIDGLNFLCSPFNIQLQALLAPVPRFSQQLNCSLDTVFGNIENFFEDFETGGWISYAQLWQPQNNFYGVSLIAANEAIKRQDAAKEAARNEGIAGQGFRSQFHCTNPDDPSTCEITTPGAVVGQAAYKAFINYPYDAIIGADDIASYVTAIADAAINQLIKLGVEGIQNTTREAVDDISGSPDCTGLTGAALRACTGFRNIFDSGLQTDKATYLSQIDETLLPRREADNFLNQSLNSQTSLVQTLENMVEQTSSEATCVAALATAKNLQEELQTKTQDNLDFIDALENASSEIQAADDYTSLTLNFQNVSPFLDSGAANQLLTEAKDQQTTIQTNVQADFDHINNTGTCPAVGS